MKKKLNNPELELVRFTQGDILSGMSNPPVKEEGGEEFAPTRQTTDFFGNTVLVPMDDDWE